MLTETTDTTETGEPFYAPGEKIGLIPLTRRFRIDSMWGNFLCASDGNVYIGSGNHETYGADAWLFRYNPRSGEMRMVFAASETLGVRASMNAPGECKIHTRLTETRDGRILFATMQGGIGHVTRWAHYTHPDQNQGGHLFSFDPKTDKTTDLGVLVNWEGIQTLEIDPQRNLMYFVTWPKKLFGVYDMGTRRTSLYGPISWCPARADGMRQHFGRDIMLARDGCVYSINHFGNLTRFNPESWELEDTPVKVREGDSLRAHVDGPDGTIYFVTSLGHLYAMAPDCSGVDYLGPVMPDRPMYTPNLALTPDGSKLIYIGGSHGKYSQAGVPLIEFDIATRTHHSLGEVNPAFFPPSVFGAQVDDRGRYLFAIHGGTPSHCYLGIYDPKEPENCPWLVPAGTGTTRNLQMEKFGGFGKTEGWIVADYQILSTAPGCPIENGRNAITSLCTSPDGYVYGMTSTVLSGKSAVLFRGKAGEPAADVLVDFSDGWPDAREARNALVCGADGCLYGGFIDLVEEPTLEKCYAAFPHLREGYAGGQLFKYNPATGALSDLGVPVAGEGIYCMCASPDGAFVYALTFPHATLVRIEVATGAITVVAKVYDEQIPGVRPDEFGLAAIPIISDYEYAQNIRTLLARRGLPEETQLGELVISKKYYVSRAIACDAEGNVFGSSGEGWIFRYEAATGTLDRRFARMPLVRGSDYGLISETSAEALTLGADGLLYGGTCQDGYLFSLDPRSGKVFNFGKPDIQGRIRGLAEWRGDIYGILGEELGKTHLFRLERAGEGLVDLGVLQGGGHKGFPVNLCKALAVGADDRLYIGQAERTSTLLSVDNIEYEPLLPP